MFCRANTTGAYDALSQIPCLDGLHNIWRELTFSVSGVSLSVTRFACEPHSLDPQHVQAVFSVCRKPCGAQKRANPARYHTT